jgi:hypothetical protein
MSVNSRAGNIIKLFGMTSHLIADDLSKIERKYGLSLGYLPIEAQKETEYYPQFEQSVRCEAAQMAAYYEIFFCLEKSIRKLITGVMEEEAGQNWWASGRVPPSVADEVQKRITREVDSGVTRRSYDSLDYTTFGELSVIVTSNWDVFGSIFNSVKAVEKIMANLNVLRAPIAHCTVLSEDEALRLKLTVKD